MCKIQFIRPFCKTVREIMEIPGIIDAPNGKYIIKILEKEYRNAVRQEHEQRKPGRRAAQSKGRRRKAATLKEAQKCH
jgi:hypothetical protein